jgi:ubiquinone/menaquinone biosynthesis C-methylase UbiE
MKNHEALVQATYNERWSDWIDVYDELVNKLNDPGYVVRDQTVINQIHRAVIMHKYIQMHFERGARILDVACGTGFNTCYLNKQGYSAIGFDFSPTAIERGKKLENKLGLPQSAFLQGEHTILNNMQDNSFDVVIAMGFLRYVSAEVRDYVYRSVRRILKQGGCFILTNTNILFHLFALNDFTLRFWTEAIQSFSNSESLLGGVSIHEALSQQIILPKREYAAHSVSKRTVTHEENPLTYSEVTGKYGFSIEETYYPDAHLLPPFLEKVVDQVSLDRLKANICLERSRDWRSMFMCYEFLSVLKKL